MAADSQVLAHIRLKLHLMRYRNLVGHHVAMCYPRARVVAESVILSCAVVKPLCDKQKDEGEGPQNKDNLRLPRS